ncbi:MAG: isoleucine--tRNA ligase [Dehalococcoidia bacterium]
MVETTPADAAGRFSPVSSRFSATDLEERVLDFWKRERIFERSVEERPADRIFSFYEGPPTANGNPGVHHVLARVFKDLIPRYKTMRGYRVPRKGGWDTHGLPVELEVERQLGLSSKPEIEAFGVAEFNERCKASVFAYVREWERMTDRIGFWIDTADAYVTYSNEYVESAWWIFKRLWGSDLMYRGYRVTPHCPRCETSLSSHEIALGYKEDTPDPSATACFRLTGDSTVGTPSEALRLGDGVPTSILAWTTTPWTLPGNTALAVNAGASYVLVELASEDALGGERVIVARDRFEAVVGERGRVLGELTGADLVGLRYEPLYESSEWEGVEALAFGPDGRPQRLKEQEEQPPRRVVAADFVATDDGTGIVHIAPAFGEDDYQLGRSEGLMFLQPVSLSGAMVGGPFDGQFAKDADKNVLRDLDARSLLWASATIRHTYPFCWRCDTPVLYYAKPSWYIRTTAVADRLVETNQDIHWVPEHIRDGRFGGWLEGNIDWAVSRERYWGTPLPLWICELCGQTECIGSFEELRERALPGTLPEPFEDPHRPFIDDVQLGCATCGGTMRRTPEVADAWFDSGAMPYAQWHYPFENVDVFDERFPADFICEAVDQTRGWFYTLHALANLLNRTEDVPEPIAFRNVICLGLILDGDGQKMSKSRGNVVNPWDILDTHGADALRWYLYTASPPGNARRFSSELVGESARRVIATLWNTYSFFVTYANIAGFDPASTPDPAARTELDRWVRSELHRTVERVTEALEAYEPSEAARPIGEFIEQLSNWYVRRSRRRFWKSDDSADTQAALHTLYECLTTVTKLLAPFTPFLAEELYANLTAGVPGAAASVHLETWPEADLSAIDERLAADVAIVQRMVSLGRGARSKAQIRVRQPLATALLVPRTEAEREALSRLGDQVADELNVKSIEVGEDAGERLSYTLRPNLPVLGPKFGSEVGKIRSALAAADGAEVARAMRAGQPIALDGFELAASDLLVTVEAGEGWAAAEEAGYVTLIDTRITSELEAEGLARELVRRLQDLRREAGLDVSDRIRVTFEADDVIASVVEAHREYIAEETLALTLERGASVDGAASTSASIEGHEVTLGLVRA